MKKHLRTGVQSTTVVVDEHGTILSEDTVRHTYVAGSKEEFYMMYSSMVIVLKQSTDVNIKLFAALLERYANGTEFAVNQTIRETIAQECGCNERSLANSLTRLVDMAMIFRVGRGTYKINPRHVFKGGSIERNKALKAIIELGCKDC